MENYNLIDVIGEGAFGSVCRAIDKLSGNVVAIKKLNRKYSSWKECLNLREVKSLQRLNHKNIVKLEQLIQENNTLYFVFEFMECNLYELMRGRKKLFTEGEVRSMCFQVFQGLAYMHQQGYFHRDLKPENLLVSGKAIKIADFGLAREINSAPPYTEYVSTRWYRAPEVLLCSHAYNSKVDMWAMGALMAELFTLRPLFPGSNDAHQMYQICSALGSPTMESWADGLDLARKFGYQFPKFYGASLSARLPTVGGDAISLITLLCSWDPSKRPTPMEALKHPFFRSCFYIPPSLRFHAATTSAAVSSVARRGLKCHGAPSPNTPHDALSTVNDAHNHYESLNNSSTQLGIQQPCINKGTAAAFGSLDVGDVLANMAFSSGKQLALQPSLPPLPNGEHGLARPAERFTHDSIYTRKVMV